MVVIEPAPMKEGLYDRIGGWLVLPAISTYLSPFYKAYTAYETLRYYADGLPIASKIYLLGFGLASIALALAWLYACVLLSRLDPLFPHAWIALMIIEIVVSIAAAVVITQYFRIELAQEDIKEAMRPVAVGLVWIPYMLLSKRVKATFYGIPLPSTVVLPPNQMVRGKPLSANKIGERDLTMVQRFGMVLYWTGLIIAVLLVIGGVVGIINSRDGSEVIGYFCLAGALVVWLIGRAIKYIFVGT